MTIQDIKTAFLAIARTKLDDINARQKTICLIMVTDFLNKIKDRRDWGYDIACTVREFSIERNGMICDCTEKQAGMNP